MISRTLALIRKEFLHILRDPRTLGVMFLLPIIELVFLGYAATNDIEHLRTAVLDGDRSTASRALIEAYRVSDYFDIVFYVESEGQMARLVDSGQAHAGLIIPAGLWQRRWPPEARPRLPLSLTDRIPAWPTPFWPPLSPSGRPCPRGSWSGRWAST